MFKLNPITKKRLQRFRKLKRAYFSFWVLLLVYALSLGSELICNDRPLLMRFNGDTYLPFLLIPHVWERHFSQDLFLGNGIQTRIDFKALAKHPLFADSSDNFMIFPPVPHGPNRSVEAKELDVPDEVTVNFTPVARVGSVDLDAEHAILRSTGMGSFCGVEADTSLRGKQLEDYWPLPAEFEQAIATRLRNLEAPAIKVELRRAGAGRAIVSMRRYAPRSRQPTKVRLRFAEPPPAADGVETITFNSDLVIIRGQSPLWQGLPEAERERLSDLVRQRSDKPLQPQSLTANGTTYKAVFEKEDISFPFRPVAGHPLGLDSAGRDVLTRILYATRIALNFGFMLTLFSMTLGIALGAVQGYFGGKLDIFGQRVIEIWSALPFLYIMILMGAVFGTSFWLLLMLYTAFNWIGISYYMRAEFLKLRKQPFVEAAKCQGLPTPRIIFRHILPNALVPVVTFFPFSLVGAIGILSALDYLGFGLPPPTPSWGQLLDQAQRHTYAWWLILYPFLALFLIMLLGVFIGEGVRTAFDPKRFSRME